MAGFGKVVFKGEYFNQQIVNVLHYRSAAWLPGGGNPFDDVQAFVDGVTAVVWPALKNVLPNDYTLQTVEGVGFDDSYNIVTSSPILKTVGEAGHLTGNPTVGASPCAIIDLRCGSQVQINMTGHSARNRGYVAVGPIGEVAIDNYSHITSDLVPYLETLATALATPVIIVSPAVTLIPIRIHQKFATVLGHKVLLWRTYSDVQGWAVRRVASWRRSRQPEA